MNQHRLASSIVTVALVLGASLSLGSCDQSVGAAPTNTTATTPVATAPANQPTAERVLLRSKEHWDKMAKADWIAVHDFLAPELRANQPLARWLPQVQYHKYENPQVLEVVGVVGDMAYVRCRALWTPLHPETQRVKLEPGQTLTQQVDVVESWRFAEGDWTWLKMERDSEFFETHSDLLKKAPAK